MKNSELPAFTPSMSDLTTFHYGLTKREYFAGLAMQGLMTKAYHSQTDNENVDEVAKLIAEASLIIADELLKQLEQ